MSKRRSYTLRKYRELFGACDECGRFEPWADTRAAWREHQESVRRHDEWHATASAEELEAHERDEKFAAMMSDMIMADLRPMLKFDGGPYTYTFT